MTAARVRWLAAEIENHLERWLAFCALAASPSPKMLNDDLFVMIEVATEVMSEELVPICDGSPLKRNWQVFLALLGQLRQSADLAEATRLRNALADLRQVLENDWGGA